MIKTHYITSKNDIPEIVNVLNEDGDSQDPRVEVTVDHLCLTCDYTAYKNYHTEFSWVFNMNSRIMHLYGHDEFTLCGKTATQPNWLWRM